MKFSFAWRAIILCCVLSGCQADPPVYRARPAPIAAAGAYIHAGSGMALPLAADAFQRIHLLRYDAAGADVSGGYRLVAPAAEVDATTYIYPAPPLTSFGSPSHVTAEAKAELCAGAFARARDEAMTAHPGAVLIREAAVPILGKITLIRARWPSSTTMASSTAVGKACAQNFISPALCNRAGWSNIVSLIPEPPRRLVPSRRS